MPESFDKDQIRARHDRLQAAATDLKAFFVGIDSIIDDLIDAIRIWYLMPEVLSRPVIVNLWGMTGVGKTDLIRRLVKALDLQDRFCEVELSNGDTTSYFSSVGGVLDGNFLNDVNPKIVLFDEIQRFNTLDTDGKPLTNTKFTDFWELLSDGRLAKRTRNDIDWTISNFTIWVNDVKKRRAKGEEVDQDEPIGFWEGDSIKRMLGLTEESAVLGEMTRPQAIERLQAAKLAKRMYEPVDHSRTLILISGNLDEAFSMSGMAGEADVDADIFHAFTQKISVVDIKSALSRRFKPEQVARFGNIHLIYTSLRRADFEELIRREFGRVVDTCRDRFGIDVQIDPSVEDLVYRNGVFPVSGVRPVFSSVIDIVESNLSRLLFEAIMSDDRRVTLTYDTDAKQLIGGIVGTETARVIEIPYVGRLDKVRDRNVGDVVANVSVHEAGHAVVYGALFGLAPLQLTARVASTYAGGFTFPHSIHETRDNLVSKMKVYLAGGIAEEIVFGDGAATSGRSQDRVTVTELAVDFVRRYGFDPEFQATYTLEMGYSMDKSATDPDIEKMVARLVAETHELLINHREFLVELARRLLAAGKLESSAVVEVAAAHGLELEVKPEGHLHLPGYERTLADG